MDKRAFSPKTSVQSPCFVGEGRGISLIEQVYQTATELGAVDLSVGNALGPIPGFLSDALMRVPARSHGYAEVQGHIELREFVAAAVHQRTSSIVDPNSQCIITAGASGGLAASILALFNPGDEIVVFQPFYEPYKGLFQNFALKPRFVNLNPAKGWSFCPDELARAFADSPTGIILNSPHNPTGCCFGKEQLDLITEMSLRHGTICLSDETYDEIYFSNQPPLSIVETRLWPHNAVRIGSFSKTYAISGWRIGSVVTSEELAPRILSAHESLTGGIANPLQFAATAVTAAPKTYLSEARQEYKGRRDLLYRLLTDLGFRGELPEGGMFLTMRPPFDNAIGRDPFQLAMQLLHEAGVGIVPLEAFYSEPDDNAALWWRLCFARPKDQLGLAARRLDAWLKNEGH
jgi:aspartate/methionine/tyrosine aminotransferase